MKTICSECNFSFKVPKQMEGRCVKCPECRHQIEILRPPTPAGVKILKVVFPALVASAISAVICWGVFAKQDQLEVSRQVSDIEKFFEKKLKAEQQKNEGLAIQLKSKTEAVAKSALRMAEEIDSLNDELSESDELLDQKERQIAFMLENLDKLNDAVVTKAEQKELKQEINLQQALEKGSDVWSLSGIKSLGSTVEISGSNDGYDLKQSDILKYIQSTLEQNDIEITGNDDPSANSNDAVLSIEIFILDDDDSGKPANVNVKASVKQNTRLLRDDTIISVGASTWRRQRWHNLTQDTADDAIITIIDDLLERFVNDFHTANQLHGSYEP